MYYTELRKALEEYILERGQLGIDEIYMMTTNLTTERRNREAADAQNRTSKGLSV